MQKPGLSRGTHDFGPIQMSKRKYILSTIENVFKLYGFMPIETPAMEQLSTLTGKYGEEGDQLLFKILNNGNFLNGVTPDELSIENYKLLTNKISEKGLRYDLTVPFARFVVMNQHQITFPFKRYQMQPVWRADRPAKGRYREFWQCDADVIGSNSLLNEADLLSIYYHVFSNLSLPISIHLNNRKILEGVCEVNHCANQFIDFCTAIDKLDKIGWDGVVNELQQRNINIDNIEQIKNILSPAPFDLGKLSQLKLYLENSEIGLKGVNELNEVFDYLKGTDTINSVVLDGTLARGLSYYTGCIVEVKPLGVSMGSIGGGGRYDDLTGQFGLKNLSGVGISFGADRIYDVMEELNLFPVNNNHFTDVLFCSMDDIAISYCNKAANELRILGIKTEVYPQATKLKKQLDYANDKKIKYAAIVGENEIRDNKYSLKNLDSGEQMALELSELKKIILENK